MRIQTTDSAWELTILDALAPVEQHDGAKSIELTPGRPGIISHGWTDSISVHLWEPIS